jgi:HSP20 family protein
MAMTDLIPWRKSNDTLAVRQRETDPFMRLRQNIDRMFDNVLGDWTGRMNMFDRAFMPTVDVRETAKEIRVTAELPGLEQKDIEVSLLNGALWIKGEKHEEHEEEKGEIYRCERQYGSFQRMVELPAEVDADKIKASFKKGVLNVTLPKTKEAQSNRRVITVET